MKRMRKYAAVLMGAFFLAFCCQMNAEAAESVAPFTADQLMAVVNAQCLNVTSVRQTITENVQAVDAASQTSVTLNLAAQLEENRTVTHSVIGMSMSVGMGSAAMTAGATSVESYTALENGVVTTWQKDPATGTWSTAQAPATYEQMTAANGNADAERDQRGGCARDDRRPGLSLYRHGGCVPHVGYGRRIGVFRDFGRWLVPGGGGDRRGHVLSQKHRYRDAESDDARNAGYDGNRYGSSCL